MRPTEADLVLGLQRNNKCPSSSSSPSSVLRGPQQKRLPLRGGERADNGPAASKMTTTEVALKTANNGTVTASSVAAVQSKQRRQSASRSRQQQPSSSNAAPSHLDCTFVTWNVGRAASVKDLALEQLIELTRRPAFIALEEIGNATFTDSTLGRVCVDNRYASFVKHSSKSPTHGGVALLVRDDISAAEWKWSAADEWSAECESISVMVTPLESVAQPFIVTALYVHGASNDVAGFRRVLFSARDDQVILADLNAQLPGSRADGKPIQGPFAQRGVVLDEFICERNWIAPTPTGPTRVLGCDSNGCYVGTVNDHILVGCQVFEHVADADGDSMPIDGLETEQWQQHASGNKARVLGEGLWPSDHRPLAWSASIGISRVVTPTWTRRVAWHRVTQTHIDLFNTLVVTRLAKAVQRRRLDMLEVERAIYTASCTALPHNLPREGKRGSFWSGETKRRIEDHIEVAGSNSVAATTSAFKAERRRILAEGANISANPSSCWQFTKTYLGFNQEHSLKPPLQSMDDPSVVACSAKQRVAMLAESYAAIHSAPDGKDPQAELRAIAATIPKPVKRESNQSTGSNGGRQKWLGLTEFRACVRSFSTGRCADPLGLRAEHLRLLNDVALSAMLPFFDRCLSHGIVPRHWRDATVTPVAKRGRNLALCRSWRPVSVTALLCRLSETVVHNRIQHVLEHQAGARSGQSQFGFRRGISTSLPLAGMCMSISDGFKQKSSTQWWNARAEGAGNVDRGVTTNGAKLRKHVTLLVSIDASDAFCRGLPAVAIRKLLGLNLIDEARWLSQMLTDRQLCVKESGIKSEMWKLARGFPQGTVHGPLLWSLVIDNLIAECEAECMKPVVGCIATPIVFADDINFMIRCINPSSAIEQANRLMKIVRAWGESNSVPFGKLQATFIAGGEPWWVDSLADQGAADIIYDDNLRCTATAKSGTDHRILGLHFDPEFNFHGHVSIILEQCERYLRMLSAMASVLSADKLATLYRGLILSRLLFAIDCWYPYTNSDDRSKLASLHYRACCVITGCPARSHTASVCYEAGFRTFEELVRDELVKSADRLRRMSDGLPLSDEALRRDPITKFGPEWVCALFRDRPLPTADTRTVIKQNGEAQYRDPAVFPRKDFSRANTPDVTHKLSLRDVAATTKLDFGCPPPARGHTPAEYRGPDSSLRPLSCPHPYPPHELIAFDESVVIISEPPDGLIKPPDFNDLPKTDPLYAQFTEANKRRMELLASKYGGSGAEDAIYLFTDASRVEPSLVDPESERCAGAFVVSRGANPTRERDRIHEVHVCVSPIACCYTGELCSLAGGLQYVLGNVGRIFNARRRNRTLIVPVDAKSALESIRTTWLCRIGYLEQNVARQLFELASIHKIRVVLAFVFSHAGGCPGNDYADKLAKAACHRVGRKWSTRFGLWDRDTTRVILRDTHRVADAKAAAELHFRFANIPLSVGIAPSAPLPRGFPRVLERLVFRARLGLLVSAGGLARDANSKGFSSDSECPLCGVRNALGPGGRTLTHAIECMIKHTTLKQPLCIDDLWLNPGEAAATLYLMNGLMIETPLGRERAALYAAKNKKCVRRHQHQQQPPHAAAAAVAG